MRQSRAVRRAIVMVADLLVLSVIMALLVRLRMVVGAGFESPSPAVLLALTTLPFISVAALYFTGFYRFLTRHIGRRGFWHIGFSLLIAIMAWALLIFLTEWRVGLLALPRTVVAIYFFAGWVGIWMIREFVRWWLQDLPLRRALEDENDRKRVLIYGAGDSGVALLELLRGSRRYDVRGFLERDAALQGMRVHGRYPVYSLHNLGDLLKRESVEEIIISMPQLSAVEKRRLVRQLARFPVRLRIVSEPVDFVSGGISSTDLKTIDINDLLGRAPARPIPELMRANISGKVVMVTGAGGSIGSEIVRKVLDQGPRRIVLFELSEYALYKINLELSDILQEENGQRPGAPEIIPVLGSVGDEGLVRRVIQEHGVQTIYHAAAYKHIPLLEINVGVALQNNVLATATLARVAQDCGVERMVLVSSDKAVRPANVKGASNRLQELVLQACAERKPDGTVFTAVRFGNVLGSSGSVVPRFREQIEKGGPVTITHPDITRYFMSIQEAAELVIQAGAMAGNGEIFALDMGEPIRIADLARLMIHLSGLTVADENNPHGDIELKFIGPRPGDKLREELLINGNAVGTRHPSIMRLNERTSFSPEQMDDMLQRLARAIDTHDIEVMRAILGKYVEKYVPSAANSPRGMTTVPETDKVISLTDFANLRRQE